MVEGIVVVTSLAVVFAVVVVVLTLLVMNLCSKQTIIAIKDKISIKNIKELNVVFGFSSPSMVTYSSVAHQTLQIQFVYILRATILVWVVFRKYFKSCCWHKRDIFRVLTNHI